MSKRALVGIVLIVSLCWLSGCKTQVTTAPTGAMISPVSVSGSSPLPAPTNAQATSTPQPTPAPLPGVPDEVAYYAGVAKYLIPRMPTAQVMERWNELEPPDALARAGREFVNSMGVVVEAHQAFNDAAFKRSTTPISEAGAELEMALQSHAEAQQDMQDRLDQFMRAEYNVSWDDLPEIVVPLQP